VGLGFYPRFLFAALIVASAAFAHQVPENFDEQAAKGSVVANVVCLDNPSQSYALYLPSHYSRERAWPVIYVFDPFARGKTAVEVYKDAAEKYGYIVVASNNSKNGPGTIQLEAAQAVWMDTHRRFAIDKDRIYTTGLSGGARVATTFALYCATCNVAGVIAVGAGYPANQSAKPANDHFLYYGIVGDADLNYPELMLLRRKKDQTGAQFKFRVYPGPHQWEPPEIATEAVEWLQLKAIQASKVKSDPAFVRRLFEKTEAEAAEAGQRGDILNQYFAVRSRVEDFKGLEDTAAFQNQLAELKSSKVLRNAQHSLDREIEEQSTLTATVSAELAQFGAGPDAQLSAGGQVSTADAQASLGRHITTVMSDLRRRAKSSSGDHLVYARAYSQLLIQGMEAGADALRSGRISTATAYFEVMTEAAPDQAWPPLALAEAQVHAGNKKAALKALEVAIQHGLKHAQSLTQDPELQPLASDPAFQRMVQGLNP
jgi:dienelactone hydrolase